MPSPASTAHNFYISRLTKMTTAPFCAPLLAPGDICPLPAAIDCHVMVMQTFCYSYHRYTEHEMSHLLPQIIALS